jgi:hypothetical protein
VRHQGAIGIFSQWLASWLRCHFGLQGEAQCSLCSESNWIVARQRSDEMGQQAGLDRLPAPYVSNPRAAERGSITGVKILEAEWLGWLRDPMK